MIRQKHWKQSEDALLLEIIEQHGNTLTWKDISKELVSRGVMKEPDQCKRRYLNNLKTDINKSKLTTSEIAKVFELFIQHKNSWKLISSFFPNRTVNIVKNTFFSLIRKCLRRMNKGSGGKVDNAIINRSRPKIIIELLKTTSDLNFKHRFRVIDLVEYFAFSCPDSVLYKLPPDIVEKAGHCIELFKRVKKASDGDYQKFKKDISRFKINRLCQKRQTAFSFDSEEHVQVGFNQVQFFYNLLLTINPLDRLELLDCVIGFISFSRNFFFKSATIKDISVFLALKKVMAGSAKLMVLMIEENFGQCDKDTDLLESFLANIKQLKNAIQLYLNKENKDLKIDQEYEKEDAVGIEENRLN